MRAWLQVVLCAFAILLGGGVAVATEVDFHNPAFMPSGQSTSVPIGAFQFCRRYSADCRTPTDKATHADLSEATWAQLQLANNELNVEIQPVSDLDQYGSAEYWTYPETRGDCEDYVLAKRRLLLSLGWPESALIVAVVVRPDGEGHAVLIVRTDRGDLVLDNLRPEISLWSQTPYEFVKHQSINLASWVSAR